MFGREGRDYMTTYTDQLYGKTCFDNISIKALTLQEKIKYQKAVIIMEQNRTTKNSKK